MIPRQAHKRSLSSEHRTLSPDKTVIKAKSTTDLSEIASKTGSTPSLKFEENDFNTLQDPRLAVSTEVLPPISPTHHPDLSNEVAALSVKLVQAINNQTTLDDSLVATRQELEIAQSKIQALEFQNEKYRRDLDEKVYIRKSEADREISQLNFALAEEKAQRAIIEQGKKTIEQELEALTADLFEEANKVNTPVFHDSLWTWTNTGLRWLLQPKSNGMPLKRKTSSCVHRSETQNCSSLRTRISWPSSNLSCKG